MMKIICSKCFKVKTENEFYKIKGKLRSYCKECESNAHKIHYKNNRKKCLERNKKWMENNKEYFSEYQKNWADKNKDKLIESRKEYNIKNKDRNSKYQKDYRLKNKNKIIERIKGWRLNNLDKVKNYHKKRLETQPEKERLSARGSTLKAKYGITLDDYNDMRASQNNSCAICGYIAKEKENLHVDHNHNTGRVRGLLCGNCNRAIGIMRDDETLLEKAISYLRSFKNG